MEPSKEQKNAELDKKPINETNIQENQNDGMRREAMVRDELNKKYPEDEGYRIVPEAYLRDKDGKIVKDPQTGEGRRIDFVVEKDGKVVDSVEVTSQTASKDKQTAKEGRIRENGGDYIRLPPPDRTLARLADGMMTRIERKD